jgi:hypothetical protein
MKMINPNRQCATLLKKISSEINAGDRRAAMKQFNISYVTVGRYLRGNAPNFELAFQLLKFLRKRLRKRLNNMTQAIKHWEAE